jgi:hypothetical protein
MMTVPKSQFFAVFPTFIDDKEVLEIAFEASGVDVIF